MRGAANFPPELTSALVDDAGTYPPASLGFDEALARFKRLRTGPERRMLRGLAWPAREVSRLVELGPVEVAAIGVEGSDWAESRALDAAALEAAPPNVEFLTYECRLPAGEDPRSLKGFSSTRVLMELAPGDEDGLARVAEEAEWAGAKLRTGGALIPKPADLAAFLHGCLALELPFKLTAGLHAPVTGDGGFGFLSVLAACARGLADDLTADELQKLIEASEPPPVAAEEAAAVRELFLAIGSCDLIEMAAALGDKALGEK